MKIRTDKEGKIVRTTIIGQLNVIVDDKEGGRPVAQFFGDDAFDNARRFINHCKFFVRGYSVFIAAFPKQLDEEDVPQNCSECKYLDECNQRGFECKYPNRPVIEPHSLTAGPFIKGDLRRSALEEL